MMDFNLILALVGVGLLLLVSVFVLLGCFAGLKKELNCTAIAFVLFLLTLLVFGDSSTILDADGSLLKSFISGIPSSAESMWDCILALVQSNVPGGAEIFVEGTKSYAFLYSAVSGVARGVMLILGTFVMFILIGISLGIYRLITRIIACNKAKKRAAAGIEEPAVEQDKAYNEKVLVACSEAGEAEGVMITSSKNPVEKTASKHRVWAGCLAGLRAVIVIIFLFAPVSGICSVLDSISPETENMINESLSGNKVANQTTALDMAMDFKDAYYDSAIGKFLEGSQFFFGDSFSTHLFDSAFTIETENNDIEIREEVIVVIDAVNALEGNSDIKSLTDLQVSNALDALKDSKLIVEAVPVAIEFVYNFPINENGNVALMGDSETLKDFLFKSSQQAAFLQLRQLDWDKNIEVLLDVVKEVYKLGILDEDFNVLTMDPEILSAALETLGKSDAVSSILNIVLQVGLKLDVVTEKVGVLPTVNLTDFDWAKEYQTIVGIYKEFQKLEIGSLENLNVNQLLQEITNDSAKLKAVEKVFEKVTNLQLLDKVAYQAAIGFLSGNKLVTDAGTDVVAAVKELANVDWSKDINTYVEALVEAAPLLQFDENSKLSVDVLNLDADVLQTVVDTLFATESFEKILPIATNIALGLPKVNELLGNQEIVIDTASINWNKDFTTLVNIYKSFQGLEIESLDSVKEPLALVKDILSDDAKVAALQATLGQLPQLTLFIDVAIPAANGVVNNLLIDKAPNLANIIDLTSLTAEEWKNDFENLVILGQHAYEICEFNFALSDIDFYALGGYHGKEAIELLFNLNLLGDDETKNQLVVGALVQFNVLTDDAASSLDLSEVKWTGEGQYSEVENFQNILTIVGKMSKLEGVNLSELKFEWNRVLDDENTYEYIVDLLDVLVDSNLVLELMPSLLEKFVVPQLDKFEDEDGTLNDIITNLESAELITEIQKLVDVVIAIVDLNVLEVKTSGIQAIDFANTDAIKTVINGIFDSKILEGYESRVVRIILKLTKVFPDLEKGTFDHVDFDKEQTILLAAIDELEVVLQDEDFLKFNEDGKLQLEKEFFLKEETLDALLATLKALLGEYNVTSSVDGSQIIEAILPDVFTKFVSGIIPENLSDLMDVLNIEGSHPKLLADDVRKVLYIAEALIDVKVQSFIEEKDYNFAGAADALQTTITTLFDLNMVHGSEAELMAWLFNYLQTAIKLELGEFSAKDFAGIDWDKEVATLNQLIEDVIQLTNNNRISSIGQLKQWISDKEYISNTFLVEHNFNVIFEILEGVLSLQIVEQILPFGLEYGLNLAAEKGIDVEFLGDGMNGELLVEDLNSLVEAFKVAVYEIGVFEYRRSNWKGELPESEAVLEILDRIFDLNLVNGKEDQLLSFLVNKFVPENKFVSAEDFSFGADYDFEADYAIIRDIISEAFELVAANNFTKLEEVISFFKEKWYTSTELVKDYNLLAIADILELVSDLQLAQQAIVAVCGNIQNLEAIAKVADLSALGNITAAELSSDLKAIASVIRQGVEANLLQYYETQDLAPINYQAIAGILETVGSLNILNNYANEILPGVLNNVLGQNESLKINYTFTANDFDINWQEEMNHLGEIIVDFGTLFEANNLDSLSDILLFINNKHYLDSIVLTEENVKAVIDILDKVVDIQLIKAAAGAGVEFALDLAKNKNFDLSFLSGEITGEELSADLNTIVEIARNAVEFGAIEYLTTKNIENIDATYVANIVALLDELNILNNCSAELAAFVCELVAPMLKLETTILVDNYKYIDFSKENELLQQAVLLIGEILSNENLDSIYDIKEYVANKHYLDVNTFNDRAIQNVQDLISLVAESDVIGVHLVDLFEYALSLASSKTPYDFSFANDVFTAKELQEDILKIVEISDYAIEFGILDLIFTGDVVINVEPVIAIIQSLEELNITYKCNDYFAEMVFNIVLPMVGLDKVHVDEFKDIDFAKENEILVAVVNEIATLLEIENFDTVSDVMSFIKNKAYLYQDKYQEYFTTEAIDTIGNIINLAVSSELVQLKLVDLFNFGISKAPATIDLSFLKNSVTADELVSDVAVIVDVLKLAVEAGGLEYFYTAEIENIDLNKFADIVVKLGELNILSNNFADLVALGLNMVLPKLGLEQVSASEFAHISVQSELQVIASIIREAQNLLTSLELNNVNEILTFVNNKEFTNPEAYKEVYSDANVDTIGNILNLVVSSEIVKSQAVKLFNFGISKAPATINLSFMKNSVTTEELVSDVAVIVNVLKHAVDAGALEFVFEKDITNLTLVPVIAIVEELKALNILVNNFDELVALGLNMVLPSLSIDQVTAADFAHISLESELNVIIAILNEAQTVLEVEGFESISGIKKFFTNKEYLYLDKYEQIFCDEAINALGNIINLVASSEIVESQLLEVFHSATFLVPAGLDLGFLRYSVTTEELVSDIATIVDIAKAVLKVGVLEYIYTFDIETINLNEVANIVAKLEEVNLIANNFGDLVALGLNMVLPKLGLEQVEKNSLDHLIANNELGMIITILNEAQNVLNELELVSLSDIVTFVNNKEFANSETYKEVYSDVTINALCNILNSVASSEIVKSQAAKLFNFAVSKLALGIDLSFMKDSVTSSELASDVATIANIVKLAVEAGALEFVFEKDITNLTLVPVIEIVDELKALNILVNNFDDLVALGLNMVLPILSIDKVSAADFAQISAESELNVIIAILTEAQTLLEVEGFESISGIKKFFTNKEYLYLDKYEQIFCEDAVNALGNILNLVVSSEIVKSQLVELFHTATFLAPDGLDLGFLRYSVTADELVNDVDVIVKIAKLVIEAGALEYIYTMNIEVVELDPVIEIVALLEQLNILTNNNAEIAAYVYDLAYTKLGINSQSTYAFGRLNKVSSNDFANIDFASDNAKLQEVINLIGWIQADFSLTSLEEIISFVMNASYLDFENYPAIAYTHVYELLSVVLDTDLVLYAVPTLFDYALDIVAAKGIDLTYLSEQFTGEQLANDVLVLAKEAIHWVRDNKVYNVFESKEIEPYYIDELAKTISVLKDVNIVNYKQETLVALITNFVYNNVFKYTGTIEESAFAGINWHAEIDNVAKLLNEVADIAETFGVEHNLLSIEGLKEFSSIAKDYAIYNNEELLENVAEILTIASKSDVLLAEVEYALTFASQFLNGKGLDLSSIQIDAELLDEDLVTLSEVLTVIVPSNILGFVLNNEELNQDYVAELIDAVKDVLSMNVLSTAKVDLLELGLANLGIEVEDDLFVGINWGSEIKFIGDLLTVANDLLVELELTTIEEIKAINVQEYATINYYTNDILLAAKDVLTGALDSRLVQQLAFKLSEKYLAKEELAGLADIHNIYDDYFEFKADAKKLVNVIDALVELDLCSFLIEGEDIPYEKDQIVETIITNVFSLAYLNKDGRIAEVISKITSIDTSNVNFEEINLAADADEIVAAYRSLLPILTDDEFFFNNIEDLKSEIVIKVQHWTDKVYVDALFSAIEEIKDTTLIQETNGAAFLLLIPLAKQVAPDYYEAIDPERLNVEQIGQDFNAIVALVEEFLALDVEKVTKGEIFNPEVEAFVINAIETVNKLNLVEYRYDEILNVTADKLDGKSINGYYFDKALYNIDDITYYGDIELLIEIIEIAFDILDAKGIETIDDAKDFISNKDNIVALLKDAEQFNNVETILTKALELSILELNILPIYNEAIKSHVENALNAELADLSKVYYSSAELVAEAKELVSIVRDLVDFGLFEILNGEAINYDQAQLVQTILNKLTTIEYLEANFEALVDLIDAKVELDLAELNIKEMNLNTDLAILGAAYEQLIPVLVSVYNPFTTLDSIKNAEITKSALYALIYDYQSIYPSVITTLSELTIAPQLVKLAANKLGEKLSGTTKELYDTLNIEGLSDQAIIDDVLVLASILPLIEELDVLNYVLYKEDIYLNNSELIANLVAELFELNVVDNNFTQLVTIVVENILNVELPQDVFATVDTEAEQVLFIEMAENAVVVMNSLDVDQLTEVKPYAKALISNLKSDVKEAISKLENKEYRNAVKALIETAVAEGRKVNGQACIEIFDLVCESELVVSLVLPVYEQLVYPELSGALATIGDVSEYSAELLAEDVEIINQIAHTLYESGIYKVLVTKEIPAYETVASYLEQIVKDACELNIVEVKVPLIEKVLNKVFGNYIDTTAIDFDSIDFAADKDVYAAMVEDLYVLLNEVYANGLNKQLVFNADAYEAVVNVYEKAIDTTLGEAVLPAVVKAVLAMVADKLGGNIAKVINALDAESIANEELLADLNIYAEILRDAYTLDVYAYLLNKEDIAITDVETLTNLVENAFATVLVDNNFAELVTKVIEAVLGVDLSNVDMSNVDYEAEQALVVEMVAPAITALNSVGVDQLSEVKPYAKALISNLKSDVKEAINLAKNKEIKNAVKALIETAVAEGRKVNGQACIEIFDLACESDLAVAIALPVYEQLVYPKLSGALATIGDVSEYSAELLAEDVELVNQIVHNLYESGIYKVLVTKELPDYSSVGSYLEQIVIDACQLNIVEVKKSDVLVVAQKVLDKLGLTTYIRKVDKDFDLAAYDLDSVSFAADAEIYASMVPYAYDAMCGLFETGLNSSFFANTDAIYALVEMYTISIETTLVKAFADKVFAVVDRLNAKLPVTIRVNEEEVLYNVSEFLFGLIELGVFSNEGIDLTDTATIQMMKEAVYDSVNVPAKLKKYIDKVCNRTYAYGVIPFNWDVINVKAEAKLAINLAKQAYNFVRENASSIKALDLAMLADHNVQADLTAMIETASESSFVEQLFFPVVEGTFNALTLSYTDGVMSYDATLEDVVNYSVPNFWKVVNAVYAMTEFKVSNINLNNILANLDAVAEIVEVLGTDAMTKDNVAKVMITGIGYFTSIELTEAEINGLLAIDFANEVQYSNKFFEELKATYDATHFSLSLSAAKNPVVLEGVANALEAILPSETVEVLVRVGYNVVNHKVVKRVSTEMFAIIDERLSDATLTNEQLIEDLYAVVELMRLAAEANVLNNTKDFTAWNFDAVKDMITVCFDTNIAQGYESDFAEACIKLVPMMDEYYDGSVVVADWEAEALAIVNVLESLVNDGITEIGNVNADSVSASTIENILDSQILSDIIVEMMNDKLAEQDLTDYYVVTKESLNKVVNWDAELSAIKDLTNLMNSINSGSADFSIVVDQYNDIRNNTVLVDEILTACAKHIVPKMPVVSDYYNSSIVIADWSVELDAIVQAYELLESEDLTSIDNPIENLNGTIIAKCLESEILKVAFIEEFNKNLNQKGLGVYYTVTADDLNKVDTASEWDEELVVIALVESLLPKVENGTITLVELLNAKAAADNTVISKGILYSILTSLGYTL